jgi:hypothetical protein
MERERQIQRPLTGGDGGPAPGDEGVDQVQARLDDILSAADRILDAIRPVNAEEYLQQNRQSGGQ